MQRINEPQALEVNLKHLQELGGVEAVLQLFGTDADQGVEETSIEERATRKRYTTKRFAQPRNIY